MSQVMRRLAGRYRPGDRGAVSALVAVLLSGGVLLGMGAIVVDAGQLYAERQQLLAGADAAAMSAAYSCADSGTCPAAGTLAAAQQAANQNAADGTSNVSLLCGRVRGTGFGSCPRPANLTRCLGSPPDDLNFVQVATSTRTSSGKTVLPPAFAGALLGPSYQGTTVGACSQVSWGAAQQLDDVFPLMISRCAWQKATGNGDPSRFADPPSSTWNPSDSLAADIYQNPSVEGCPADGHGSLALLLGESDSTCTQALTSGTSAWGIPAVGIEAQSLSAWCTIRAFFKYLVDLISELLKVIFGLQWAPTVRYLPVYDGVDSDTCVNRNGSCAFRYKIVGFAAFEMTGGAFGAASFAAAVRPWGHTCYDTFLGIGIFNNKVPCFTGFFTKRKLSGTPVSSDDFGVTAFRQTG